MAVFTVERGQLAGLGSGRFQHEFERRRGDRVMIGGDLECLGQQMVGVFHFPGNQSPQGTLARSVGFPGIGPDCAEDFLRRGVTLEPGQAGDRGHAHAGFVVRYRLDQGRAKGFVAIAKRARTSLAGRRPTFPLPGRGQGLGDLGLVLRRLDQASAASTGPARTRHARAGTGFLRPLSRSRSP